MKIARCYHPGAPYAIPADSLREAAQKMRGGGLSCLPVLEGSTVLGIITERDLVEAMAAGVSPTQARVGDYTNDGSVTVSMNDESEVAQMKMLAIGCRHLPVVDRGNLVGMVSERDVFKHQAA